MITTIFEYKQYVKENINSYDYTVSYEDWDFNQKIILRNENSPNQKLIGVLIYETDLDKSEIYLESISVMPYYKKLGYAKHMFDLLVDIAEKENIKTIRLKAYPFDQNMSMSTLINIYKKWGFVLKSEDKKGSEMIYTV